MMNDRCTNPQNKVFQSYGGRGIVVCDRWRESFEAFLSDMGPRPSRDHSIERRDNDGPYTPDNCIWATQREQTANRRSNRFMTHDGQTLHLAEWARRTGIGESTLRVRIKVLKWTIAQALGYEARPRSVHTKPTNTTA
jgi:hypothetical protein